MDDKSSRRRGSLPVANYSSAIARAVDWLGDRYLLARPINGRRSPGPSGAGRGPGEGRA